MKNNILIHIAGILGLLVLAFLGMETYAQDAEEQEFGAPEEICAPIEITILWPEALKINQSAEYAIQSKDVDLLGVWATFSSDISWTVPADLTSAESQTLNVVYSNAADYELTTQVTIWACTYTNTKSISVYDRVTLYIWKWRDELGLTELEENNTRHLVKSVVLDSSQWSQQVLADLLANTQLIKIADELMLDSNTPWPLLEAIWQFFNTQQITTTWRSFYLISDVNQAIYRKLIARYLKVWWLERINIVDPQYFGSLYTALLLQQDPQQFAYVREYSANLDGVNKLFFVSYFVDYLLLNGFPLQFVILMLILPLIALLISFARQVIGMRVFGLFGPLLFALCMSIMGWKLAVILLLAATLAVVLTSLFSQKVYLLSSPKIATMIIMYTIFAIFLFWMHEIFDIQWFSVDVLTNSFVIFWYLAILISAKYLITDTVLQFKKWRWISLIEFVILSVGIFYLVRRDVLQNIMLWYPELILLILVLNIVVGRFTWLQVKEYERFAPLIWYNLESEVEEE